MGVRFFGQFLLERNIVKPNELIEAVECQRLRNLKFGQYALSRGYLTEADVQRVLAKQRHVDMLFGEIAVELNLLTQAEVEEILTIQENDHIFIGEALVEKGFLTEDVLERELTLFMEDQSKYVTGEIVIPEGVKNPEVVKDFVDLTQKMFLRMADINVKFGDVCISNKEPERNFLLVKIPLSGGLKYEYATSLSRDISLLVTSGIIGEEIDGGSRELLVDGVKEFCNIICGNIITKVAQRGKVVNIAPPQEVVYSQGGYQLINGRSAIYCSFISPKGNILLILIEGQD